MARSTSGRRRVGNLPADSTSFVGRRHELAELKRLLSEHRLVTLTGPGGVGKTRLALRVAADVRRAFQGEVWFVDLAQLREPRLIAETVAGQLDVREQSSRPVTDTIIDRLSAGPLLLVLDNCEHLIDDCATLVSTLILSCPELRVLTTSRQSLGLVSECMFPVVPFVVPDPDQIGSPAAVAHFDSVRLFIERATAVVPRFNLDSCNYQALARICHDLDGIPLAIELTVARLRSLSLEQLAERLHERHNLLSNGRRGLPPRHRTLRALIDWSYELCSEMERRVWACASVFSGTFDLEAVEFVAGGDDVPCEDVLVLVDALVDKSIFLPQEGPNGVRYRMLDTTREYGEEKLVADGRQVAVRHRHRDWFAQLATRFAAAWVGPDEPAWNTRLHQDYPNVRVALDCCARENGDAKAGLRMAVRLVDYWTLRGYLTEGRMWLDRLLSHMPGPSRERLSGLVLNAWFTIHQGDLSTAQAYLAEAAELTDEVGNEEQNGYLAHVSGMAALVSADLNRAVGLFGEACEQFRNSQLLRGELFSLFMYGLTVGHNGEPERGRALLDTCIDKTIQVGDIFWRSYALWARASIDVLDGDFGKAEESCKEALRLEQLLGDKSSMAFTLEVLAWAAEGRREHARAATLFGIAGAVWEAIGGSPELYATLTQLHHEHLDRTRDALGDSGYEQAFKTGYGLSTTEAIDFALETTQPEAARQRPEEEWAHLLTRREFEIAQLVAEGLTNRDIAARLVISPRTAEGHVEKILSKLGFSSRAQIAAWMTAHRDSL
ncbi:LuxR C-terminal-related transcriptional regulator [Saccharopolyspora sp. K220]|uniref:ATP-binding protein n=1 Tax=Saccharopolyspora soli TaxID=2926618 RepID=UPI001F5A7D1B|nr:LuxR C-terminal-related transcriptional regulator [Saccharopolyspora soli]MCI2424121.1 LuxR C-terminal-related transcriptional regulator [Saccharopolyspora soli]